MGCCIRHDRSEEEEYINYFFSTLPIKNTDCVELTSFITAIICKKKANSKKSNKNFANTNNNDDKALEYDNEIVDIVDIIKEIQAKYFTSNCNEFSNVKLLQYYFNYNPTKYILWGILTLTKFNNEKLKHCSVIVLNAIGENSDEMFNKDFMIRTYYINCFLKPVVDMISRFSVKLLSEKAEACPLLLESTLIKPFSTTIQDELIVKLVKNNEKVFFDDFLLKISNFVDFTLRDNLVSLYNSRNYSEDRFLFVEENTRIKESIEQKEIDELNSMIRYNHTMSGINNNHINNVDSVDNVNDTDENKYTAEVNANQNNEIFQCKKRSAGNSNACKKKCAFDELDLMEEEFLIKNENEADMGTCIITQKTGKILDVSNCSNNSRSSKSSKYDLSNINKFEVEVNAENGMTNKIINKEVIENNNLNTRDQDFRLNESENQENLHKQLIVNYVGVNNNQ